MTDMQTEAFMSEPQTTNTMRRQGRWARPVDRLDVPDLPKEAINLNVRGRRLTGPVKGFGQLWKRTYAIQLVNSAFTPTELIQVWREQFPSFWPPGSRYYGIEKPIDAGDIAVLNLAGPAGTMIATGIMVIYADEESFCFMSAEGHMFGGMITFSAHQEDGVTVAQVQALLRASDPFFETIIRLGLGTKAEDEFWHGTLKNVAAHFGVTGQPVSQRVELLDPRLQWAEAKNIWYNAAIRTALYMPVRWLRNLGTR
jgi:hypothetical protein